LAQQPATAAAESDQQQFQEVPQQLVSQMATAASTAPTADISAISDQHG
jgi:hypothetical protein